MKSGFVYDIHGLVGIESAFRLPELKAFQIPQLGRPPDLRIIREGGSADPGESGSIIFEEALGRIGFRLLITLQDPILIRPSPLIQRSPHVLYTNVIEPILRWVLVRRDHALIHSASIALGSRAALITAATDTGKTTTILRSVSSQPWAFLADDMTILRSDGALYSFPKPLTISYHTLKAVGAAALGTKERFALQLQSRLHSKTGRAFGLLLQDLGLPAASLNALVQILIPPPKFMIQRLLPSVLTARSAQLEHVILIEQGDELQEQIDHASIVEALMRNAEDAYGFPPYASLAPHLVHWKGQDLAAREREIVASATQRATGTLLRSRVYSWGRRIPGLLNAADSKPVSLTEGSLAAETRPSSRLEPSGPAGGLLKEKRT